MYRKQFFSVLQTTNRTVKQKDALKMSIRNNFLNQSRLSYVKNIANFSFI